MKSTLRGVARPARCTRGSSGVGVPPAHIDRSRTRALYPSLHARGLDSSPPVGEVVRTRPRVRTGGGDHRKPLALLATVLLLSSHSIAATPATLPGAFTGTPPSFGHDFVTITHAGNRDLLPSERVYNNPFNFPSQVSVGGVSYEYRIAKREVSSAQWLPFIQLAWPVFLETGVDLYSSSSSGRYIIATATHPGNPNYVMLPGGGSFAPSVAFRAAAIYCNWLHNGAPTGPNVDLNVFRNGAYDTSTFTNNPGGTFNDQINRSEGALFWIPTLDEWTKAVFYDPHRYGPGEDGYWRYSYGDEMPVFGEIGDPLAQWGMLPGGEQPPIASFPNALTPWGLLDAAGSVAEGTDTVAREGTRSRFIRGSGYLSNEFADANDYLYADRGPLGSAGFRIASAVPIPGTAIIVTAALVARVGRRRCRMSSLAPSPSDNPSPLALFATVFLLSSPSLAGVPATLPGVFNGPPPSHGHDFVTITHAGNRDMLESERIWGTAFTGRPSLGGVNYEYRIGRTEITATQWLSFIRLAWPVAQELGYATYDTEITSSHILNTSAFGAPNYIITPGRENFAVNVSWRMAAMYCNWLHNGAPTGPNVNLDAFRRGAYDTVTFTRPTFGQPWIEQATRSEGALFWIPTLDEWIKAVYFDPNRYGEGQDGYWYYQYGNDKPVFGFVGQPGAQTGPVQGGQAQGQPPVGSFPNALTPWGLLDAAGSLSEWTEERDLTFPALRVFKGSSATGFTSFDANDRVGFRDSIGDTLGLRVASAVPGAGTLSVFIAVMASGARRARRCVM